jgi:hypothetical protein
VTGLRLARRFVEVYGQEYALSAATAALQEARDYAPARVETLAQAVAILEGVLG